MFSPVSRYRPELDGVRGVSVLAVMMFHLYPKTGGWLGVDVFFVLSGFLITSLLVNEWDATRAISLPAFFARRARRILPALVTAITGFLILTVAVHTVRPGHQSISGAFEGATYGLLFVTDIAWGWFNRVPAAGLSHLWSLSIEEQFYLLWPATLLLLLRLGTTRRWIAALMAGAALAVTFRGLQFQRAGTHPFTIRPDSGTAPILVGCACALIAGEPRLRTALMSRLAGLPEVLIAVSLFLDLLEGPYLDVRLAEPVGLLLFSLAVGYLILRMTAAERSAVAQFLDARPLVAVGRVSYGLYLWHVILIDAIPGVPTQFSALAAIPVAFASHKFIERPFLDRNRLQRRALEVPTGAVEAPVAAP